MRLSLPYAGTTMRIGDHAKLLWNAAADGCATMTIAGDHDAALSLAHLSRFYQTAHTFWIRFRNAFTR